jgi:hypothetical protein
MVCVLRHIVTVTSGNTMITLAQRGRAAAGAMPHGRPEDGPQLLVSVHRRFLGSDTAVHGGLSDASPAAVAELQ